MASSLKTPDIVLRVALNEVGYLEKASNNNLDDKTANAGYNNYTKYWRDLYPAFQGQPWCNAWVNWIFVQAYGYQNADKMLCGAITCIAPYYTPTTAHCFKASSRWFTKDPKVGDIIYFNNNSGVISHVGIVQKIENSRIYTIEGNTSSGNNTVVSNGGAVATKYYSLNNSRIAGFGRPKYDNVDSLINKVKTSVGTAAKIQVAQYYDKSLAGTYTVTASTLNLRASAGTASKDTILEVLPKGTTVQCYGYYNVNDTVKWLYCAHGKTVGYLSSKYLMKTG